MKNPQVNLPLVTTLQDLFPGLTDDVIRSIKVSPCLQTSGEVIIEIDPFLPPEQNRNHWDERAEGTRVSYLILHYTQEIFSKTINTFTKDRPTGNVSAHYVMTQKENPEHIPGGFVLQVVPEEKRAWHAGISYWDGQVNLNDLSIGIENVNQGCIKDEQGSVTWFPFDESQIDALGKLTREIVCKYNLEPTHVLGHADIAPGRKEDPGILFPWKELYTKYGVGAWLEDELIEDPSLIQKRFSPKEPLPEGYNEDFFKKYLSAYGYSFQAKDAETGLEKDITPKTIQAFKAHFSANQCPQEYQTPAGRKEMIWAWGLCAKYGKNPT